MGGGATVGIAGGRPPQQGDFFFFFGVPGHIFFRAIFIASDTQHNLNEHTLKGGGKSTDTHKIKGLKLSAAKKGTKEMFISDNLQGFPGATL